MFKTLLGRSTIALLASTIMFSAMASSHREAPGTAGDPRIDNTDVYAFRSPDAPDTVTLIANFWPFQEAGAGPNFFRFDENAVYEIHVDNNGDAVEDITYQFRFRTEVRNGNTFLYNTGPVTSLDDADLNVRQFYTVNRVSGDRRRGNSTNMGANFQAAPPNIGPKSTPSYTALADQAIGRLPNNGGRVFAGQRDDSFFIDLGAAFDLLTLRPLQQLHKVPPVLQSANGIDYFKGYNVQSIAIQVPITSLTRTGQAPTGATDTNAIIGVWSTVSRSRVTLRSTGTGQLLQNVGGLTQVSRLGNPLVNEVVIPLMFKDIFNSIDPVVDHTLFQNNETFRNRVLDPEIATLINALYGVSVPAAPRNDLVAVFLTGVQGLNQPQNVVPADMLRLNMAIPVASSPNRLGVIGGDTAGFPNGRRLTDDVVDIALRAAAGVLVDGFNKSPNNALTDGVDGNEISFLNTFPYIAPPHSGFNHPHHGDAPSLPPSN